MRPSLAKADLVIFDCYGVLVDSEVLSCECLSEVLGQYGIVVSQDEALERFLGRSAVAVLHHYRNEPRLIPETFLAKLKALVQEQLHLQSLLAEVSAERSKLISSLGSMPDLRGDDLRTLTNC